MFRLVQRIARGDERAFAEFYDAHARVSYSLAIRLTGNCTESEDVVQEAFLEMWRVAAGYAPSRGSVRTWVLTIVHHRAVDRVRKRSATDRRDDALRLDAHAQPTPLDPTPQEVLDLQASIEVREALERLPAEQADAIRLAYFGGFSHREIASTLSLPLGTIKGRIRLGLNGLRAIVLSEP